MATFTIEFTVPDEYMDRIRYALRKQFGQVTENVVDPETGAVSTISRDMNGDELLAKVREISIENIKSIIMNVEANEAAQRARDAVTSVVIE